nr:hypothetical protein [uncultured Intestinibacter sp.]DAY85378.1 MAG TPA: hypothetical protein [Caudoviricetes sp.]
MARTFTDINGNRYSLENLQENFRVEVGVDTDIVTGEPTGYTVILDGEETYQISEEVYEALKQIL